LKRRKKKNKKRRRLFIETVWLINYLTSKLWTSATLYMRFSLQLITNYHSLNAN
jgi:hypothetical protein